MNLGNIKTNVIAHHQTDLIICDYMYRYRVSNKREIKSKCYVVKFKDIERPQIVKTAWSSTRQDFFGFLFWHIKQTF